VAAFGVEHHQLTPPAPIQARVVRVVEDRQHSVTVQLDNGQTWAVDEAGVLIQQGEPVTIHAAALGSFLMVVSRRSYRVRRLQ
jgi:hypothetical protein